MSDELKFEAVTSVPPVSKNAERNKAIIKAVNTNGVIKMSNKAGIAPTLRKYLSSIEGNTMEVTTRGTDLYVSTADGKPSEEAN